MKKNKILLLSTLGVLGVASLSLVAVKGESLFLGNHLAVSAACESCTGNHYTGQGWNTKTKGKGSNGYYENWHCCVCHKRYFDKNDIPGYDASKWVDNGTINPYMDKTDLDDNRMQFGGTSVIHKINHLTSGTITVDGQRDDLYNAAVKYNFESAAIWPENGGSNISATLEALWQEQMVYVYVDVNDPTKATKDFTDSSTNNDLYDNIEFRIDTLHSEKYANSDWDGYINANYRQSNSSSSSTYNYAVVGKFRVCAGYEESAKEGGADVYTSGCWFDEWTWLSGKARRDTKTYIKSHYYTDTHWGAEFAIYFGDGDTVVNSFGEIGMLLKINDKSGKGVHQGILNFENIGDAYDYPRNFSNFRLVDFVAE